MAEVHLFREVLQMLLASPSQGGCGLDIVNVFQLLREKRCPYLEHRNVQKLKEDLQNCTRLFEVEADGRSYTVFPRTSLTICPRHSNKSGSCPEGTCPDLHLCIFFLLCGECRYGKHCYFGHDLGTPQNQRLLDRHLLAGLCITDLRILFCLPRARQGVTMPQVCRYFSMSKGCNKGSECHCLHLCLDHVLRQCESSHDCGRNHDMSHSQVSKVLRLYGVRLRDRTKSDILEEVRLYHRRCLEARSRLDAEPVHRSRPESGQRAPSGGRTRHSSGSAYATPASLHSLSAKVEEICLYHLKRECRFKENCKRLHSSDGFLWRLIPVEELEEGDGVTAWKSLPPDSNEMLEKAYCLPQETNCVVTDEHDEVQVDFRTMIAENVKRAQQYKVCRLHVQGGNFATVWVWYWKNRSGTWQEFGREENGILPVTSETVEQTYQVDARKLMEFDRFVIDFAKMRLKDVEEGRKFKVRRRPLLALKRRDTESEAGFDSDNTDEEGSHQGGSDSDSDDDRGDQAGTSNVVSDDEKDDEARASDVSTSAVPVESILCPIYPGSEDYKAVHKRFVNTLGIACTVDTVHRVVNHQLKARYEKMRLSMKTQSRGKPIEEKELYYRFAQREDVTEIYMNGASCNNPPITVNDRNLGRGGHFCVTASEANKSIRRKKERRMYLMKCLVGHHTGAQVSTQGYGCYVDNAIDPKVFVIENPSQTCPVYLITYSLVKQC